VLAALRGEAKLDLDGDGTASFQELAAHGLAKGRPRSARA
jgi:hypothetical protein